MECYLCNSTLVSKGTKNILGSWALPPQYFVLVGRKLKYHQAGAQTYKQSDTECLLIFAYRGIRSIFVVGRIGVNFRIQVVTSGSALEVVFKYNRFGS